MIHRYHKTFESVTALKIQTDEFQERVAKTTEFSVGYYDGKQSSKLTLLNNTDLEGGNV